MFADVGLLLLRLTLGLVFLGHGAQKAFGAFGGPGFAGATGFIGSVGLRPARFWTALAVSGELVAGVLFVLGLLTPVAGLLVLATMAVAIAKVHGPKGFFVQRTAATNTTWCSSSPPSPSPSSGRERFRWTTCSASRGNGLRRAGLLSLARWCRRCRLRRAGAGARPGP